MSLDASVGAALAPRQSWLLSRRLLLTLAAGVGAFVAVESSIRAAQAAPTACADSVAGHPSDGRRGELPKRLPGAPTVARTGPGR